MGSEWLDTRLGDICEIRRGSSPRPIVEYLSDIEGMPWVKIADATESDSRFIRKTNQFIRHEGVDRSVIVHKGDLILSNSGTAGLPRFMEITACIHDGWQVLRKLNGITSNYLYCSLIYIRSKLLHNAYDSTMICYHFRGHFRHTPLNNFQGFHSRFQSEVSHGYKTR